MIELTLVRHAEPDWEPSGRAVDQPSLTMNGRAQAERTARELATEAPFDKIYSSPLQRVRETLEPIQDRLGRTAEIASWLAEQSLPSLHGKTPEEVQRFFSSAYLRELEHWWEGLPGGGESFRHFHERVSAGIEGLLANGHRLRTHEESGHRIWQVPEKPARILVVAHQGTNAVILAHLLGIEPVPWAPIQLMMSHAGITRVRTQPIASGAIWVMESFNRVHHLADL